MLNELYIEAYITLANYITLIIFVFCAMFNNNLQQYILAEGKVELNVSSSGERGEGRGQLSVLRVTTYNDVWQREDS